MFLKIIRTYISYRFSVTSPSLEGFAIWLQTDCTCSAIESATKAAKERLIARKAQDKSFDEIWA